MTILPHFQIAPNGPDIGLMELAKRHRGLVIVESIGE